MNTNISEPKFTSLIIWILVVYHGIPGICLLSAPVPVIHGQKSRNYCMRPDFKEATVVGNATKIKNGNRMRFNCNPAYVQLQFSMQCLNGTWQPANPPCQLVFCPIINATDHAAIDGKDNGVNATRTITCRKNFKPRDPVIRTCERSGNWSGPDIKCEVICPELPIPPGGIIIYTGDRAELVCNQGYNASASTQRQCESSGNWNGEKWSCTKIVCDTPRSVNNGDVFWNETQYQDSAQLRCNDGYGHSGHSITMCQANGTWFPPLGPCILQATRGHYSWVIVSVLLVVLGLVVLSVWCVYRRLHHSKESRCDAIELESIVNPLLPPYAWSDTEHFCSALCTVLGDESVKDLQILKDVLNRTIKHILIDHTDFTNELSLYKRTFISIDGRKRFDLYIRKQLQDKQFADLYFMLVLCFCDVVRIGPQITEQERREKQEILLSFVLNMRKDDNIMALRIASASQSEDSRKKIRQAIFESELRIKNQDVSAKDLDDLVALYPAGHLLNIIEFHNVRFAEDCPEVLAEFLGHIRFKAFSWIDESAGGQFTEVAVASLAQKEGLRSIGLEMGAVSDDCVGQIASVLKQSPSLLELLISCEKLTDKGVQCIVAALEKNTILKDLKIGQMRVKDAGATALLDSMQNFRGSVTLYDPDCSREIKQRLREHQGIRIN